MYEQSKNAILGSGLNENILNGYDYVLQTPIRLNYGIYTIVF